MGADLENKPANEVKTNSNDENVKTKESPRKQKCRKRKRNYYNAIRGQMEFYFGDANLCKKDRFLKQLIDKDPYVPLDVFLTFNKMKTLTSSTEEIAKSLTNSQLLELDETQQKVRRKTAIPVERNVDEKTLYVEALPPSADHDWVRQVFERFGAISYVSLPKYAKSRKIKEFGFVEFDQESSVEKAIKAFKEFNGVLNMEAADPGELKSVKAFLKEQNQESDVHIEGDIAEKKAKKRPKSATNPQIKSEDDEPKSKKSKTDDEAEKTAVKEDKDANSTSSETADDSANATDTNQDNETDNATKKKRRKKKKKKLKPLEVDANLNADFFYELKILAKRDWKRLRNKYLNLQREKISELKRKAWKEQQQQARQKALENNADVADATATPPSKKSKPSERKLHRMNMNFYGAGGEDEPQTKAAIKEVKQNPALERAPLFSYEPGLIVEVSFMEPCVNVKEFKADMRQYDTVKYIDVKEGALHAHLRLASAEAANDFVRQINCAEYSCKMLAGEAEVEYWKKIEQDREMKLNKQVKVPQKRGREKIKKLVTKHIRFGDDDEE